LNDFNEKCVKNIYLESIDKEYRIQ
jgi:hypothetical protein